MTERLQTLSGLAPTAKLPAYDRDQLKSGILHLGPGAFSARISRRLPMPQLR